MFPGRKEFLFMDPAVVSCMMNQCDGERRDDEARSTGRKGGLYERVYDPR